MRTLAFFAVAIGFAVALGCTPYDPDLGTQPFLCGPVGDECPDGYSPARSGAGCVCTHKTGGGGGDCSDPHEPNNVTGSATDTPVGNGAFTVSISDADICDATDVDTYLFRTTAANQGVTATVTFDGANGVIGVNIVAASGTPIAMGATTGNLSKAMANLPTAGMYYVQVVGSAGGKGAYSLEIKLN